MKVDLEKLELVEIESFEHQYRALLRSGMFFEIYPKMKGKWMSDRQDFIDDLVANNAKNKYSHLQNKTFAEEFVELAGSEQKAVEIANLIIRYHNAGKFSVDRFYEIGK